MYAFFLRRHFIPGGINQVLLAGTLHLAVVLKYLPQSSIRQEISAELLRYSSQMCLDSECLDIARIEQNIQFEMCLLKKILKIYVCSPKTSKIYVCSSKMCLLCLYEKANVPGHMCPRARVFWTSGYSVVFTPIFTKR